MKLNQLPEGYEGPQRRRTEFESPEEKLGYDSSHLIARAREILKSTGVPVSPDSMISRKDDDVAALRKAIAVRLIAKSAASSIEVMYSRYKAFIDGLNLSDPEKEKLKEMMSDENYLKAVATAQELDFQCEIPAYTQIAFKLMTYAEERLHDICEMMAQPTLLIVPESSFKDKIAAMDAHKHYTNMYGEPQADAYVDLHTGSPYIRAPRMKKVRVSIVDGVVHPPYVDSIPTDFGRKRDLFTQRFTEKNMRHIDKDEMATLFQRSLMEAKAKNDNGMIVDNWESGKGTVTVLDPNSLAKSKFAAYAVFDSEILKVFFGSIDYRRPLLRDALPLRGRASMQVLEF